MGNQIAVDLGPVYLEVSIFLAGSPFLEYANYHIFSDKHGGTFYFIRLQKEEVEKFKNYPIFLHLVSDGTPIQVTGVKFDEFHLKLQTIFSVQMVTSEKTKFSVKALDFFWKQERSALYQYRNLISPPPDGSINVSNHNFIKEVVSHEELFPCLLVNVRSGISLYRVNSLTDFVKVGGSSFGGSTFWALVKLLCTFSTPTEALESALIGNNVNVDMTVGDIYGRSYDELGLPHNLIASSCAKLRDKRREDMDEPSVVKSLLLLFLFNMTQISYMQSLVEEVDRVVLVGDTMHNQYANQLAQYCIDYWSQGKIKFIQSDFGAYFGCFGALLKQLEE